MTTKDYLCKCISIYGVPEEVGVDILRQEIKNQYHVNAVRIEEITCAEADNTRKRWILELEGEQYAKQLKGTDLKLEFDEECVIVKCKEPSEFELPQVWISQSDLDVAKPTQSLVSTSVEMSGKCPAIGGQNAPLMHVQFPATTASPCDETRIINQIGQYEDRIVGSVKGDYQPMGTMFQEQNTMSQAQVGHGFGYMEQGLSPMGQGVLSLNQAQWYGPMRQAVRNMEQRYGQIGPYGQLQTQQHTITRDPISGQYLMHNVYPGMAVPVAEKYMTQMLQPQPPQQRNIEQGHLHTTQTRNAGEHITIEAAFDDSPTKILVQDIPAGLDKDSLEIIFASKNLGSCKIEEIDFDEVEMNAVIRFSSPDDVRTVLNSRPIEIKKKEVSVEMYVPTKQCEITVRGPTDIMEAENDDIFKSYFENEKKSGGGDVTEIKFRSTDNVFVVTFEDDIVAKRVVERGGHRILSKDVNVELLKHSRSTKSTDSKDSKSAIKNAETGFQQSSYGTQTEILVEDIPPGVDDDSLWRVFTSRKLKSCTIEEIDFDEVEMNAVIRFESPDGKSLLPITQTNVCIFKKWIGAFD
ncbi:hypothetical protein DPMN_146850 [Dreissena polymorpha]|uniref:RRM domain-containing protein n=1 Tax=Dreissena polymorpha TaxID=45954 RepID=A0A9D4J2R9_DREPO|nr:hypothetical protein DPMN_146850 [Dreissena polymorpha]